MLVLYSFSNDDENYEIEITRKNQLCSLDLKFITLHSHFLTVFDIFQWNSDWLKFNLIMKQFIIKVSVFEVW